MDLKKSYREKYGCERVITDRNSPLSYVEADMIKLAAGEKYTTHEAEKETVLVVLAGTCAVTGKNFAFPSVGKRKTPFDGAAECVYVGKGDEYTIEAKGGDVRICACKAPAEKYFGPQYIAEEKILVKPLGRDSYARTAAFNFDDKAEANLLYIGEFWVEEGNWASFPPHKHDVEHMPTEGFLDEVYYYEFDREGGFGVQMVYSAEGDLDEAYRVKTGDFVEIPKGYHPFSVAPGYKNYCLWIMAGKNRGIFCTTEEAQVWINKR